MDAKPGFRHEPCQKGYYVDGHEKLTTIEYIKQLLIIYLSYEQRAHRWVQIPLLEALELEEKKLIPKNSGYRCRDDKGGSIFIYLFIQLYLTHIYVPCLG